MDRRWLSLALASFWISARPPAISAQAIPFRVGVMLTFATKPVDTLARPDFERVLTLTAASPEETQIADYWSYAPKATGKPLSYTYHRTFSRRETTFARRIWWGELGGDTAQHRGTSYMMASSTVMRRLLAGGEVEITLLYLNDVEQSGPLQRIEPTTIPVSVLINGQRQTVPAIHARLSARSLAGSQPSVYDFWFADDTAHAWMLRSQVVQDGVVGTQDLVRVDWTDTGTGAQLAAAMARSCRVQVYGIHFATGSADVAPASTPTLDQIAVLLQQQPTWKITIEGHTDSIGGAAYNQDLSNRRAAAVKDTLVARYKIESGRLSTAGFGLTHPIETNTTLAGRARNRRVELVRACSPAR
jgi:outer membrane protein OmpA-like peptidoglycan-associated protein